MSVKLLVKKRFETHQPYLLSLQVISQLKYRFFWFVERVDFI
jgi:hypothetical protein